MTPCHRATLQTHKYYALGPHQLRFTHTHPPTDSKPSSSTFQPQHSIPQHNTLGMLNAFKIKPFDLEPIFAEWKDAPVFSGNPKKDLPVEQWLEKIREGAVARGVPEEYWYKCAQHFMGPKAIARYVMPVTSETDILLTIVELVVGWMSSRRSSCKCMAENTAGHGRSSSLP